MIGTNSGSVDMVPGQGYPQGSAGPATSGFLPFAQPLAPVVPTLADVGLDGAGEPVAGGSAPIVEAGPLAGSADAPWEDSRRAKLDKRNVRRRELEQGPRKRKLAERDIPAEPWEDDTVKIKKRPDVSNIRDSTRQREGWIAGAEGGTVRGVYKPNLNSPVFRSKTTGQPTELAEQFGFLQWVRQAYPQARFFAVPNGGKRDHTEQVMKIMEGMSRGVPDLWFPQRKLDGAGNVVYGGLVIEMKRSRDPNMSVGTWHGVGGWGLTEDVLRIGTAVWSNGTVSDDQKEWLSVLAAEGYLACVCNGMREAMAAVEWYYAS